jgi:NAD(P)-dependent dehydrogenase (short-subunit alcohol dehydrogenase family)
MYTFENQNVLVTAGARGIGRFIAASFVKAGANVHVADIDASAVAEFKKSNPGALASQVDVANESAVDDLFRAQREGHGDLDILVNCAGIQGPTAAVEDIDFSDWRQCVAVNLDAAFLCSRRAVPMMKAKASGNGRGNIINISSTAGWHGYPFRSPYSSAKWAVIGLTKSLAMELGTSGIRVNAICPGTVDGNRMDRVIAAEAKKKGVNEQQIRDEYTQGCSMRTMISGEDIADMALFLASDAASKITGQAINVDGHLESFAVS